jgi:hypothetical protein
MLEALGSILSTPHKERRKNKPGTIGMLVR